MSLERPCSSWRASWRICCIVSVNWLAALAAHLILQLCELFAGALTGGGSIGRTALLQVLCGLLRVLPRLIHILASLREVFLVLRFIQPLLEFIGVLQLLLLLFLQTGELALGVIALLLGLGFLQRGLRLAGLAVQIFLAAVQGRAKAVEHLPVLILLRSACLPVLFFLLLRLALGLVAVLLVGEIELVELLLPPCLRGVALLPLAIIVADDFKLPLAQLEEIVIRSLFSGEGVIKRPGIGTGAAWDVPPLGGLHKASGFVEVLHAAFKKGLRRSSVMRLPQARRRIRSPRPAIPQWPACQAQNRW